MLNFEVDAQGSTQKQIAVREAYDYSLTENWGYFFWGRMNE